MRIAGRYSFKGGREAVTERYPALLAEVEDAIRSVDAATHKTKASKEKTKQGRVLYSPGSMNRAFKKTFAALGWKAVRETCEYEVAYHEPGYQPTGLNRGAYREMDFVKDKLGVEVQFGKYSFMVYNVAAKMTIFKKLGHIDCGIEVVPVKAFAAEMSSGVSYFEQFTWDLKNRGEADIDIPVLILGIDK